MWNLTKDGFVSVVAYDPKKDRDPKSPFPQIAKQAGTHLLVRARRMEHLEPLKRVVPNLTIVDDRGADYRFRCVVKRQQYKDFLCRQVDEIDYWSHFKEAMRASQPSHLREPMYSAAMKVWGIFAGLQASSPYTGHDRTPSKSTPAHTSVADYQASKGIKPFKSTVQKTTPTQDALFDAVNRTAVDFPAIGSIDINDAVTLIGQRKGSTRFSSSEFQRMDDDAFELVTRLQEKYGTTANVSQNLVTKARDELLDAEV